MDYGLWLCFRNWAQPVNSSERNPVLQQTILDNYYGLPDLKLCMTVKIKWSKMQPGCAINIS